MRIHAAQAVVGDELLNNAVITVTDGAITGVTTDTEADSAESVPLLLPGFVDQHCHGGDHADFFSADTEQIERATRLHLQRGTTSLIASLVTAKTPDLIAQMDAIAPLVDDGRIAGIHLEGPWLSEHQCGAHDVTLLRDPDPAELQTLLTAGGGHIRMATVAPEREGALDAIRTLVDQGVVAAVGHTDCDYSVTESAIDAGATVATHLLNRMPAIGKRDPGPVVALMEDPRVTVELIADGVHLDPAILRLVAEHCGPQRVALVTDAMGAAGAADGRYVIGQLDVIVKDRIARLASNQALAGSTLTLDEALRVMVQRVGLPLAAVSRMLSGTPAQAMGLTDRGSIAVGQRADFVALDDDLTVRQVMQAGQWIAT